MTDETKWIYESPNGGKTVYKRPLGADINLRQLHHEDPEYTAEKKFFERWHKFRDILTAANSSPSLEKILAQAEMLYELQKDASS